MFRNDGNEASEHHHLRWIRAFAKGHGIAMGDVNRDGDLDIYAVMGGALTGDYLNALYDNPARVIISSD